MPSTGPTSSSSFFFCILDLEAKNALQKKRVRFVPRVGGACCGAPHVGTRQGVRVRRLHALARARAREKKGAAHQTRTRGSRIGEVKRATKRVGRDTQGTRATKNIRTHFIARRAVCHTALRCLYYGCSCHRRRPTCRCLPRSPQSYIGPSQSAAVPLVFSPRVPITSAAMRSTVQRAFSAPKG